MLGARSPRVHAEAGQPCALAAAVPARGRLGGLPAALPALAPWPPATHLEGVPRHVELRRDKGALRVIWGGGESSGQGLRGPARGGHSRPCTPRGRPPARPCTVRAIFGLRGAMVRRGASATPAVWECTLKGRKGGWRPHGPSQSSQGCRDQRPAPAQSRAPERPPPRAPQWPRAAGAARSPQKPGLWDCRAQGGPRVSRWSVLTFTPTAASGARPPCPGPHR